MNGTVTLEKQPGSILRNYMHMYHLTQLSHC